MVGTLKWSEPYASTKPLPTMVHDWWVGQSGNAQTDAHPPATRAHILQPGSAAQVDPAEQGHGSLTRH
jgi:hypothetical protein